MGRSLCDIRSLQASKSAVKTEMPAVLSVCAGAQENEKAQEKFLCFLARLAGFEPATYRFVAGHSIH